MSFSFNPPSNIEILKLRIDVYTNQSVTRGGVFRLQHNQKYPQQTFKQMLQCSPNEPDLNDMMGSLSFLKLVPPTKQTVELMCAFAETREESWS